MRNIDYFVRVGAKANTAGGRAEKNTVVAGRGGIQRDTSPFNNNSPRV
tara:strand:+ start:19660 stop:19803 length:144 start_codon:yes stop_codon:yes gene_type:complete